MICGLLPTAHHVADPSLIEVTGVDHDSKYFGYYSLFNPLLYAYLGAPYYQVRAPFASISAVLACEVGTFCVLCFAALHESRPRHLPRSEQ